MTKTIEKNLKQYLLKNKKGNHELDNETIKEVVEGSIAYNKELEEKINNMNFDEFTEYLEYELSINIFETNFDYLVWCYEDESVYSVLQDLSHCEDINTLVKYEFNDDTYQFKNGLIVTFII